MFAPRIQLGDILIQVFKSRLNLPSDSSQVQPYFEKNMNLSGFYSYPLMTVNSELYRFPFWMTSFIFKGSASGPVIALGM